MQQLGPGSGRGNKQVLNKEDPELARTAITGAARYGSYTEHGMYHICCAYVVDVGPDLIVVSDDEPDSYSLIYAAYFTQSPEEFDSGNSEVFGNALDIPHLAFRWLSNCFGYGAM